MSATFQASTKLCHCGSEGQLMPDGHGSLWLQGSGQHRDEREDREQHREEQQDEPGTAFTSWSYACQSSRKNR